MKNLLFIALVFVFAGCVSSAGSDTYPNDAGQQDFTYCLVKEVYLAQANADGEVDFALPYFDAEYIGIPLVATYESSGSKFGKLYLNSIPHTLDTLGHVYIETDPWMYVAIVVVLPRQPN